MANNKSIVELILKAKVEGEKSFDELSDSITKMIRAQDGAESSSDDLDKKLEALRVNIQGLVKAENDLIKKGRLVEQFKAQAAATSKADAKAKQLIQTAKELRSQLKATSQDDPGRNQLEKRFDRASAAAQRSVLQFKKQRDTLAQLNDRMRKSGLSASNLANTEKRLGDEAGRLSSAQAKAANSLAKTQTQIGKVTRATQGAVPGLSRFRAELLRVAAVFVSFQGFSRAAGGIVEAGKAVETALQRFQAGTGSLKAAKDELEFTRQTAKDLKLEFQPLIKTYARLVASSKNTELEGQRTRNIFLGVATAARVMQLGADEVGGSIKALEQIISKGRVSAEELRQQLGDRMTGAFQLFADGLGISTGKLDEMLKAGELTRESLVNFGDALLDRFGNQVPSALRSATAAQAAFRNELFFLQEEAANSGFLQTFTESLHEVTGELQSPEFKQGARTFGELLGGLAKVVVFLIKNMGSLTKIIGAFTVFKVVSGVKALSLGLKGLAASATAAAGAMGLLSKSLLVIGAAFAGFELGRTINQFKVVRATAVGAIGNIDKVIQTLIISFRKIGPLIKANIGEALNAVLVQFRGWLLELADLVEGIPKFGEQLAIQLRTAANSFDASRANVQLYREELKRLNDELAQRKGAIDANVVDLQDSITGNPRKSRQIEKGSTGNVTGGGGKDPGFIINDITTDSSATEKLHQDTLSRQLKASEQAFEDGKLTIRQYYADRQHIQLEALDSDLRIKQAELEAAKKQQADTTQILADIEILHRNKAAAVAESKRAEEQAERDLFITVSELRNQLITAEGNDRQARLNDLQRDFEATVSRLRGLGETEGVAIARKLFNTEVARVELEALEAEKLKAFESFQKKLDVIANQESIGALSSGQAVEESDEAREGLTTTLDGLIDRSQQLMDVYSDNSTISDWFGEFLQATKQAKDSTKDLGTISGLTGKQINQNIGGGLTDAFVSWADGSKKAKAALGDFSRDFLRFMAQAIIKTQLLKAIGGAAGGGGIGGILASALVGTAHTGAVIGEGFDSYKRVPALAFVGAPKYHQGGVVGLQPSEVPIIAEKGEEVLTRMDPRHRDNVGKGGSVATPRIKIVNTIDSEEMISEGLSTGGGEQGVMNVIQANKSSIKQILDA